MRESQKEMYLEKRRPRIQKEPSTTDKTRPQPLILMLSNILKVNLSGIIRIPIGRNDWESGGGMGEGMLGDGGDVECPLMFLLEMPNGGAKCERDDEGEGKDGEEHGEEEAQKS